ncbi:hypothetical protein E2C01_086704 [Portunus trituberculatus]|uniref:Uncharacterized protein n=1 Tax=Portunus trituberculatus TaxID=210409 RepID=A0A5B7J647_PORTR|nr:hypothetical protein [Portunus trituberculatus]
MSKCENVSGQQSAAHTGGTQRSEETPDRVMSSQSLTRTAWVVERHLPLHTCLSHRDDVTRVLVLTPQQVRDVAPLTMMREVCQA